MIQVTFNYEPETGKVSGVNAVNVDGTTVLETKTKTKTKTTKTKSSDYITLKGGSLQLTQAVIDNLGVVVGDRLCVRFNPHPVLVRPDTANEERGGNLITKALTVSVRGKVSEQIAKFGTEFTPSFKSEGYLDLIAKTSDVIVQDENIDKEQISETTIDDSDFLAGIEDGTEIDFTFDI